jgi:hypothetical protein
VHTTERVATADTQAYWLSDSAITQRSIPAFGQVPAGWPTTRLDEMVSSLSVRSSVSVAYRRKTRHMFRAGSPSQHCSRQAVVCIEPCQAVVACRCLLYADQLIDHWNRLNATQAAYRWMRTGQSREPPRLMTLVQPDPAAAAAAKQALKTAREVSAARKPR